MEITSYSFEIKFTEVNMKNFPQHIGIIMDGNGRWAKSKGLNRNKGHEAGAENLIKIVEYANSIGIENLTVFAFSTENWQRPEKEVNYLMSMPAMFFKKYLNKFEKKNILVDFIGSSEKLSSAIIKLMDDVKKRTKNNTGLKLIVAFNYGGRDELLRAIQKIIASNAIINEEKDIEAFLDTKGLPDIDLLIRTSGEQRVSNFLLWQSAYSEIYFTKTLWPDFSPKDLDLAISDYQERQRRFGGL